MNEEVNRFSSSEGTILMPTPVTPPRSMSPCPNSSSTGSTDAANNSLDERHRPFSIPSDEGKKRLSLSSPDGMSSYKPRSSASRISTADRNAHRRKSLHPKQIQVPNNSSTTPDKKSQKKQKKELKSPGSQFKDKGEKRKIPPPVQPKVAQKVMKRPSPSAFSPSNSYDPTRATGKQIQERPWLQWEAEAWRIAEKLNLGHREGQQRYFKFFEKHNKDKIEFFGMAERRGSSSRGPRRNEHDDRERHRDERHRNGSNPQANRRDALRRPASPDGGRGGAGAEIRMPERNSQAFTLEIPRKKFTGRCRLFVGNLVNDVKEEELKKMFGEFGEINECYLSGKGFAFLRLDTRAHAESAKEVMDGKTVKGRPLRVRFAVHGAALKIKELSSCVSNEMLYHTFSVFGEVERAVHIVDERGKPTGEGIVEFERKSAAQEALKNIEDRVFMMTAHSHPLLAEMLEPKDDEDGLAERMIHRTPQTLKEREVAPHFAEPKSFEFVYGQRWKELYQREKEARLQLEEELKAKRAQLQQDMQIEYDDYRAQMLREDLERQRRELEQLEAAQHERRRMGMRREDMGRYGEPPQNILVDGPHGRPPPTYGREPSRHENPALNETLDVKHILQSFRQPELQQNIIDPHALGVQRSLNHSLGLGDPLGVPPMGPPPPNMGPPQVYGGPPSAGFFNVPHGGPTPLLGPPGPVPLSALITAQNSEYRPDAKRQRR